VKFGHLLSQLQRLTTIPPSLKGVVVVVIGSDPRGSESCKWVVRRL